MKKRPQQKTITLIEAIKKQVYQCKICYNEFNSQQRAPMIMCLEQKCIQVACDKCLKHWVEICINQKTNFKCFFCQCQNNTFQFVKCNLSINLMEFIEKQSKTKNQNMKDLQILQKAQGKYIQQIQIMKDQLKKTQKQRDELQKQINLQKLNAYKLAKQLIKAQQLLVSLKNHLQQSSIVIQKIAKQVKHQYRVQKQEQNQYKYQYVVQKQEQNQHKLQKLNQHTFFDLDSQGFLFQYYRLIEQNTLEAIKGFLDGDDDDGGSYVFGNNRICGNSFSFQIKIKKTIRNDSICIGIINKNNFLKYYQSDFQEGQIVKVQVNLILDTISWYEQKKKKKIRTQTITKKQQEEFHPLIFMFEKGDEVQFIKE